jgi:hypothetical protein
VIWVPVAVFQKSPIRRNFSSLRRLIKLASDVNTMGGDLLLPVLSCVSGAVVEIPSLLGSAFYKAKSLSGAKKLFDDSGRGCWSVGGGFFCFVVQHSSSEFLPLGVCFVLLAKHLVPIPCYSVEGSPSFIYILLHTCEISWHTPRDGLAKR